MILVIGVCKERLHYYEFIKPIEDLLSKNKMPFFTKHYLELKKGDLMNSKKIIICGTSLKDNDFLTKPNLLVDYLMGGSYSGPVFGICAGMQLIGKTFWLRDKKNLASMGPGFQKILKNKLELGFFEEELKKDFLGFNGRISTYHLHQNYVEFEKLDEFEIFSKGKIPQAIKHKTEPIYGVLFHPEVRNKEMIVNFLNLED